MGLVNCLKNTCRLFRVIYLLFLLIKGIPVNQQHLLLQQTELNDATILGDIPIYEGMRLKLVLGMKVGPIQSRRVLPSLSDYDSWFDMNDMQNAKLDFSKHFLSDDRLNFFFFLGEKSR